MTRVALCLDADEHYAVVELTMISKRAACTRLCLEDPYWRFAVKRLPSLSYGEAVITAAAATSDEQLVKVFGCFKGDVKISIRC